MIIYMVDIPHREVKAEELMDCSSCKKKTKHRYEVVSFHSTLMFVKVFCYKRKFIRICGGCNYGTDLTQEEFEKSVERILYPKGKPKRPSSDDFSKFEESKKRGIKYCNTCGERIYPDIGYCTSCAVRGKK